ncbi:MAG TPA: phospholipase C, phosphocholine-specific [Streptosporangiaceae bacterium]|nr:phospholipase C, phosphocholine-specific [Streptosporangiaceae bacterium]
MTTLAFSTAFANAARASGRPAGSRPAHTAGGHAIAVHAAANPAASGTTTSSTLTETPVSVPNGASFMFTYTVAPADQDTSTNWIGIYEPGQTPGVEDSTCWNYVSGASGTATFPSACLDGVGQYVAWLFYDNGYQELAGPVDFSVTPSQPAPAPQFATAFGQHGPGQLTDPFGIAAAPGHSVWVADRAAGQVEQFSASGQFVRAIGRGVLLHPDGVAVDSAGDVWVADTGHDQIVEFSASGRELTSFGSDGSGNAQLDHPQALAIDSAGNIWVADQDNNRIEEFASSGSYLSQISVATPDGITIDAAGNLWVSSPSYADGNAVYEFAPDGTNLEYYGSTQAEYGAFSNTAGIAIGPAGKIYVVNADYSLVTVLNPDGSFYTEFGLQSNPADAAEDLAFPQGIAVTANGTVYVADSGNGRVVEYSPARAVTAAAVIRPAGASFPWRPTGFAIAIALALAALAGVVALRRRRVPMPASPMPASPMPASTVAAANAPGVSRRSLLASGTALTGAATGAAVLPLSLRRAMAKTLRDGRQSGGSISDIEHIVILMQENRSFDHYYGTMPGVRGFQDPTAITLPTGNPVFYQPDPSHAQGYLLPFYYDPSRTSAQATPGTDHSWPTQHQAWDNGKMDQWIAAKGPYTMGYFKQQDIPFHWALAESFTICDNYHCSVLGPTNPNRLYLWTGMIDPNGTGGGPIIDNTPAFNNIILSWTTYPERLEAAGISWKVYQEEDNYDDNALAWFKQFGYAPTSSPLWQRGMYKGPAGAFESDARNDRLPQVSWLVAPTAQTEHPDYFPAAGAEYIAQKLDAIATNPDVWAKTAFILCYDENDGMFDHVPPPFAPAGAPDEFVNGLNIGLGFRTPTTIVSPWTAGGFVCSEVFDHSSLIRFIEARFGVYEPNISAWRRQTCGDLTSAFRFGSAPSGYPGNGELGLAVTESRLLRAQAQVNDNPFPVPPAVNEPLPAQ